MRMSRRIVFLLRERRIISNGTTDGLINRRSGLGRDDAPLCADDAGAHRLLTFTKVVADSFLIVAEVFRDFAADLAEPFEVVGVGLCAGCAHGSISNRFRGG